MYFGHAAAAAGPAGAAVAIAIAAVRRVVNGDGTPGDCDATTCSGMARALAIPSAAGIHVLFVDPLNAGAGNFTLSGYRP